jgi:saccharopine dehydrogenase-like NADP-dependent oxidoreductase
MERFAMRYPGHADFWYRLIKLGFTDDAPVAVGGCNVSPRQFLVDFLTPKLQFGERERDVAIIRVTARGVKNGAPKRITYELIDYRDLSSGLFAMNRTVGFTTSIGAQMILSGAITDAGVLSPIRHVDPHRLIEELGARGIRISCRESEST